MLKEEYGTMKKFACLVVLVVSCMAAFATVSTHAAKSPCREITFEPLPMKFGDSAQRGTPYAKDPTVIRHDGRYLMYYSVRNCDKDHFHEGDDPIRLKSWWGAVAESTNLVDWTRIGDIEISDSRFISAAVAPCVKKIDGKIHMFHQARRQPDAKAGDWACANKDDLVLLEDVSNLLANTMFDVEHFLPPAAVEADIIALEGRCKVLIGGR